MKIQLVREKIREKLPDGSYSRNFVEIDMWKWFCPGCGFNHNFWMDGRWSFDGNIESPTFSPSLLLRTEDGWKYRCHTFVRNGKIQYLDDCTHKLRGQTIDMVDV